MAAISFIRKFYFYILRLQIQNDICIRNLKSLLRFLGSINLLTKAGYLIKSSLTPSGGLCVLVSPLGRSVAKFWTIKGLDCKIFSAKRMKSGIESVVLEDFGQIFGKVALKNLIKFDMWVIQELYIQTLKGKIFSMTP